MVLFKKPRKSRSEDGFLSFYVHSKYAHDEVLGLLQPLSYDPSMQDKVAYFISTVNGGFVSGKEILDFYTSVGWVHAKNTASKYGMLYKNLAGILKDNPGHSIKAVYENNSDILYSPLIFEKLKPNSDCSYNFVSGTIKRLEELCNDTFTDMNHLRQGDLSYDTIAPIVELYKQKLKDAPFPSPVIVLRSDNKESMSFLNKDFLEFAFKNKVLILTTSTPEPIQKFELSDLFREAVSCRYEKRVVPLGRAEELVVVNKILTVYKELGAIEARFGLSSLSMEKLGNLLNNKGYTSFLTDKGTFSKADLAEALKAISPLDCMAKHFSYLLILHNRGIITGYVKRYLPYAKHLYFEDLVQESNIAVINASKRFLPGGEVRFATYAGSCIEQAIHFALANKDLTIPLTGQVYGRLSRVNNAVKLFLDEHGRVPTDEELAERVNCSIESIKQLGESVKASQTLPLEVLIDKGEGKPLVRTRLSKEVKAVFNNYHPNSVDNRELVERLLDCDRLTSQERNILKERVGLDCDREHTLEELGKKFDLTRERIRQIEKKAKGKLLDFAKYKKLF